MDLDDVEVSTVLGKLRVRVGGSGPAILFWPTLIMDGSMWTWTAQAEHFGVDHRVVLVDSPGHGCSEALTRPFTCWRTTLCAVTSSTRRT